MLQWDRDALIWINAHHNRLLDAILAPVAYAGELGLVWIVVCLVMLIVGKPGQRKAAVMVMLTMFLVDRLIASPLGHWVYRQRPYAAIEGIRQIGFSWTGSSFPSAHAESVWIATVILGSRWRRLIVPLIAFALLTCYSRPYFGMHYPADVIIGSAMGIAAGFAALGAEKLWRRRLEAVRQ